MFGNDWVGMGVERASARLMRAQVPQERRRGPGSANKVIIVLAEAFKAGARCIDACPPSSSKPNRFAKKVKQVEAQPVTVTRKQGGRSKGILSNDLVI